MLLKNIIAEDFVNYKKPSLFLCTSKCSFKCGKDICQNAGLMEQETIQIDNIKLIDSFLNNPITNAVVIGGLEPFDTFEDTLSFIDDFRHITSEDIVIYTGYEEDEIKEYLDRLSSYGNIIIKFGRYKPGNDEHFDEVLGISLSSDNQYAKII